MVHLDYTNIEIFPFLDLLAEPLLGVVVGALTSAKADCLKLQKQPHARA